MQEEAVVISTDKKRATVKLVRSSACDRCQHSCSLAGPGNSKDELEVQVANPVEAKAGERVALEMRDRNIFFASFLVYLFPLLFMFLGYFITNNFAASWFGYEGETVGMMGALIFLLTSFFALRKLDKYFAQKSSFQPEITKVIARDYYSSQAKESAADQNTSRD